MGLVSEIRGFIGSPRRGRTSTRGSPAGSAERIAAIEAALGRLTREREAASEAIATASEQRRELLLRDDTDSEIEELERDADRRHRDLERLELLEADLLRQLGDQRDVARNVEWESRFARLCEAAADYLIVARQAKAGLDRFTTTLDEARAAGFETEARSFIGLTPQMLDDLLLDTYEAKIEQLRDRNPISQPARPVPLPRQWPPPIDLGNAMTPREVRLGDPPPTGPRVRRSLRCDTEAAEGERLITILRSNIEIDGFAMINGDRLAVAMQTADRLVLSGAADFI